MYNDDVVVIFYIDMGARRFFIFPMSDCYTYIIQYGAIIFLVLAMKKKRFETANNAIRSDILT